MAMSNTMVSVPADNNLLQKLHQEHDLMLKEINNAKKAGLYADSLKDPINDIVIHNREHLECKLNYLGYLPRKILRKAVAEGLDKEELRYLFVIVSEVNSKGIIRDTTIYQLIQIIKAKYGEDTCNTSTYYKVHKNLVDKGFIKYENRNIILCDYAGAFKKIDEGKSLGSIVLPSFVFTYSFKNMSITAYRLMMEWMDLIGSTKTRKYIHYKLDSSVWTRMKKRCAEEVRPAINELSCFFNIREEISGIDGLSVYHIALKNSFIMDEKDLSGVKQPVNVKHGFAFRYILKLLRNYGIMELLEERRFAHQDEEMQYEDIDIYQAVATITKLLSKYLGCPLKKIMRILKNNLLNIRSIGGFITKLIDIYILGKSYAELELKQIKKDIDKFIEYGFTLEDIRDISPGLIEKYNYLVSGAVI